MSDTRELMWFARQNAYVNPHRPEPKFPMPNDHMHIDKRGPVIVVASIYYTDDEVLVLLLHNEPPFFEVGHWLIENDALLSLGTFENIVPAVAAYQQNGGDY